MKKYKIIVNGTSYEVEIEEINENEVKSNTQSAPKAEATPAPAAAPSASGTKITAPIPGTVLDIKVNNGDSVKAGQTLIILESMKMENEIKATADGKVTVHVTKGSTVASGAVLCSIN